MLAGLIAAWIAAQAPAASFEVASIKANRSGERIMLFQPAHRPRRALERELG